MDNTLGMSDHDDAQGCGRDGRRDNQVNPQRAISVRKRIATVWSKTGIDYQTAKMMLKSSLAPTLVLAAFQGDAFANYYTTLGYLTAILSVLTLPSKPRATFLQMLLTDIITSCLGIAVILLAMYCCIRARAGSQTPDSGPTSGEAASGVQTVPYNSSASAVAGVWHFVLIYVISVVRARMPQYNIPCVLLAIMSNVAMVYAPQFLQMSQSIAFAQKFLVAYLTGFAMATGVSLLIFPTTCRSGVFNTMNTYITNTTEALDAQMDYLRSLEDTDMFAAQKTNTAGQKPVRSPEAEAFRAKMRETSTVYAKLVADVPFAKREIAYGKLGPSNIQQVFTLLRLLLVPMTGLSYVSDIFERTSEERGWDRSRNFSHVELSDAEDDAERLRIESINEWHALIRRLKEPFENVVEAIGEGLQHAAIQLEFPGRKATSKQDVESGKGDRPRPGGKDFAQYLDKMSQKFLDSKKLMLRSWSALHGIELDEDFFERPSEKDYRAPAWMNEGSLTEDKKRLRRQLALMLYIEYTLFYICRRTYDLVVYTDELRASGLLSQKRIIVPGTKRLRKWAMEAFFSSQETSDGDDMNEHHRSTIVQFGDAYKKKDPEHLPPETSWEQFSDRLRSVAHFFASPSSHFGFRVAVAATSLAIVSFLGPTQVWSTKNRLFWAQIMVSIGMQPSAGNTLQMYIFRTLGTTVAMLTSWIAWYVVDQKPAGVIVFYFLLSLPSPWIILKYPRFTTVGMVYTITMIVILGYELQVKKLGIAVAQSNGQEYYPIYILGLVRLATVVAGLTVAWIFTIFPYPISEHSKLRQSLGVSLHLLANYYSLLHETVRLRLSGSVGDPSEKGTPAYSLEKMRLKLFAKCNGTLSGLKAQADATKFDIPIGGKFPREQYYILIDRLQNLLNYMTIVGIASGNVSRLMRDTEGHGSEWLRNFRRINNEANVTTEAITALLVQLSSAIITGHPLPPHLDVPEPYGLAHRMDEIDRDLLSLRHLAEPGYSAFAVVLIGTKCITDDLQEILDGVRKLVGVLDFSYRVLDGAPVPTTSKPEISVNSPRDNNKCD